MRVNCPECGREFDIPDAEGNRLLRCICKNLFRANDASKSSSSKPLEPQNVVLETKRGFYMEEEQQGEAESSISEGDMDSFLSTLKKNKKEISLSDNDSRAVPKVVRPADGNIELGDLKTEKKPKKDEESLPDFSEPNPSYVSRPSRKPVPPPRDLWDKIQDLSPKEKILGGSALGVLLIVLISVFSLREKPRVEVNVDPSISKLLTPRQIEEERRPAPIEPAPFVKAPAEPARYLDSMRRSSYAGDFENVIRIGAVNRARLRPSELALFFDAQLIRAGNDGKRITEIRAEIEKVGGRDMDSVLRRSHSLSLLKDPALSDSLPKILGVFKSLSLTRADDPLVYAYLGLAYEKLENLEQASAAWDQAITLEPNLAWLLERREQIFRARKEFKNASDMAGRLAKVPGFEARGYELLYELEKIQNNSAEAIKNLKLALKAENKSSLRIALANELGDRPKDALKELESALSTEQDPKARTEIQTQIGRHYCNLKNYNAGLAALKKALKEKPDYAAAHFERGFCESKAGNNKKAATAFAAALKYNPQDHRAWFYYGISLQMDNKIRAAVSALTRSIQIRPTDAAHLQLAEILASERKRQEALVHAKRAIKLNPKNAKAQKLIADLQR